MNKNIVFYFTGTGNSLKVARDIAQELDNCEIKLITNFNQDYLEEGYDSVGFVYPVYASNLPNYFIKFLQKVNFNKNKDAYFYAVSTQGSTTGNSLANVNKLLEKQGLKLNGAFNVKMFANYVALYNMKNNAETANKESSIAIKKIATNIKGKVETKIPTKVNKIAQFASDLMAPKFATKDKDFNVSSACNSCGICIKVCPVRNVEFDANKQPTFKHTCEQCMACIQNCPNKALNYKNKTQKRGRYINPEISVQDLYAEDK